MPRQFIVTIPEADTVTPDGGKLIDEDISQHIRDQLKASCGFFMPEDYESRLLRNVEVAILGKVSSKDHTLVDPMDCTAVDTLQVLKDISELLLAYLMSKEDLSSAWVLGAKRIKDAVNKE